MLWGDFWDLGAWCLFDDSDKNIILKHPYEAGARGGWQTLRPYRRADAVAVPVKKTMPTPRTGRVLKFG